MEKIQATTQVERLLRKGSTKGAIDHFLHFLESYEEGESPLYQEMIQVKAQFLRAQRRRSIGIISAKREEELTEEIHAEIRFLLARMNGRAGVRKKPFLIKIPNYAYFIAMGIAIVTTFLTYNITRKKAIEKATAHCPVFHEESEFNILILPLGDTKSKTGKSLETRAKDRFQLFIDSMNLDISAEISGLELDNEKYPKSIDEAVRLAQHCQAQLVLWAEENQFHYKFIQEAPNFAFYQLYPGQGEETIPIAHPTSVSTHGVLDKNADPSVLNYLLGTAANQIEAYSSAAQLLRTELVDSTNTDVVLLRALQLADGEMEVNNPTQAIKAYDTILELHSEYDFARLNRSVLAFNAEKFELALQDLQYLLDHNPKNYLAHYTKGRTLAKMDQIAAAIATLSTLDTMLLADSTLYTSNFRTSVLQKTSYDLAKKELDLQKELRKSKNELRDNPDDESLRNKVLTLLLQLGEDEKAFELLENYQPNNPRVLNAIKARNLALETEGNIERALLWKDVIPAEYAEVKLVAQKEEDRQVL